MMVSSTVTESLLLNVSLFIVFFFRPQNSAMQSVLNFLPAMQYRKKFIALKRKWKVKRNLFQRFKVFVQHEVKCYPNTTPCLSLVNIGDISRKASYTYTPFLINFLSDDKHFKGPHFLIDYFYISSVFIHHIIT